MSDLFGNHIVGFPTTEVAQILVIFSGEPTSSEWSSFVGAKRKRNSRRLVDVKKGDMLIGYVLLLI